MIEVEVVYALPDRQWLKKITASPGTTLEQAIRQSGVLEEFPDLVLAASPVGVFGRVRPLDTVLRQGDRVEIYRPLAADPKETRRRRAARQRR
jgi:uncharacterized protein